MQIHEGIEPAMLALNSDTTPPAGTWFIEHGTHVEGVSTDGRDVTTITFVDAFGRYVTKVFSICDYGQPHTFKSHVAEID